MVPRRLIAAIATVLISLVAGAAAALAGPLELVASLGVPGHTDAHRPIYDHQPDLARPPSVRAVSSGYDPSIHFFEPTADGRRVRRVSSCLGADRVAPTSALDDAFQAPGTVVNRHGQLTNGTYTLDAPGMAPHQVGNLGSGKSQFFSTVDADTAVLDAAAYADEAGLWVGNRAKVFVENGPVGALATTGEPTQWINVYRTNTGFVHGTPGTPP